MPISISIIVPVYNVEKYLCECLDSILAQTYSDFELILVDDGSADRSGAICDEYAERDKRIRVFHQENKGQSAARNFGIDVSCGEWIHFVDSDDVIHPQMVELLYTAATEACVNYAASIRVGLDKRNSEKQLLSYEVKQIDETVSVDLRDNTTFYWTPYASLIKRSIVECNKFAQGKIYEDNAVCFKWIHSAGKISVVNLPLYFYRDNPTGTMNKPFSPKKLDYLWALEEQIRYYEEISYNKMLGLICKTYVCDAIWMSKEIVKHLNDEKLQKEVLKKAESVIKKYGNITDFSKSECCYIEKRLHPLRYKIKRTLKLL